MNEEVSTDMDLNVGFRFFAVPAHLAQAGVSTDEVVEPELPPIREAVEKALSGAQFRDMRARDRLKSLLESDHADRRGKGHPAGVAIFARPPDDLPALLRLADQLDSLAQTDVGERALVWKCLECGTRYAVPVALVRRVQIPCERCGKLVSLAPEHSLGEEGLLDPFRTEVNKTRRELAGFFREAMARGWPVLVCATDS